MRVRPATVAAPLATATLALGTAAWAADVELPLVPAGHVSALAVTAQATGPIVANDLEGSAVLHADALAPGETTTGEVTIRNAGDAPGAFTLSPSAALDTGAPLAGPLSAVLDLTVTDISGATPATLFAGKLGALRKVALGTFPAGAAHRYRFALTYPPGIPAEIDNAYQGASTSIQFDWDAVAIGGTAGTTPTTPPTGSGTGSGGATGAAGGPAGAGGTAPATSPAAAAAIPATTATSTFRVTLVVRRKRPVVKGRLVTALASTGAPGTTVRNDFPSSRPSPPGVASQTTPAASSSASKTVSRASGSGGTNVVKRPSRIRLTPPPRLPVHTVPSAATSTA